MAALGFVSVAAALGRRASQRRRGTAIPAVLVRTQLLRRQETIDAVSHVLSFARPGVLAFDADYDTTLATFASLLQQHQPLVAIPAAGDQTLILPGWSRQRLLEALDGAPPIARCAVREYSDYLRDLPQPAPPPRAVPERLYSQYTMDGGVKVLRHYVNSTCAPGEAKVYSSEWVESLMARAAGRETGEYKKTDTWLYEALTTHSIHGKSVAVMGSTSPWYESISLDFGARCTTIEYNAIESRHPRLRAMTPSEYAAAPETFDAAISISSFEHDGLGRYGDPLDPDGDLKAMAAMRSMLGPNGRLFLAVPLGQDSLVWNAHRVYGRRRLPLLLRGWNLIDSFGYEDARLDTDVGFAWDRHHPEYPQYQPILVLAVTPP